MSNSFMRFLDWCGYRNQETITVKCARILTKTFEDEYKKLVYDVVYIYKDCARSIENDYLADALPELRIRVKANVGEFSTLREKIEICIKDNIFDGTEYLNTITKIKEHVQNFESGIPMFEGLVRTGCRKYNRVYPPPNPDDKLSPLSYLLSLTY